jgi:hypothetical protein
MAMAVDGLFKRYQRWNPVHPTGGAFWGLGLGFGCGVGWGPGFGPEPVGFVGSGCGFGFSVGLTFLGFGLGLPAHGIPSLPFRGLKPPSSVAYIDLSFSLSVCVCVCVVSSDLDRRSSILS